MHGQFFLFINVDEGALQPRGRFDEPAVVQELVECFVKPGSISYVQ
jgi:hypothetical protein